MVEDILVPDEFKFYDEKKQELFLLADSGKHVLDSDRFFHFAFFQHITDFFRVMIFGRAKTLEWSCEMTNLYFDGTFSISPPPFNQVSVHMIKDFV